MTVGYTVTAPPGTHVTVAGFATETTVKGIKGDVSVELVGGTIAISGAARVSSAKTLSGTISISDVEGDGNVTASSLSGVVTIERVKSRQVNVDSLSGGIVARDVNVENAVLKTMNGGIEYSGAVSRTGRYEMHTHNGSIGLTLGGDGIRLAGPDVRGRNQAGRRHGAAQPEPHEAVPAGNGRDRGRHHRGDDLQRDDYDRPEVNNG